MEVVDADDHAGDLAGGDQAAPGRTPETLNARRRPSSLLEHRLGDDVGTDRRGLQMIEL